MSGITEYVYLPTQDTDLVELSLSNLSTFQTLLSQCREQADKTYIIAKKEWFMLVHVQRAGLQEISLKSPLISMPSRIPAPQAEAKKYLDLTRDQIQGLNEFSTRFLTKLDNEAVRIQQEEEDKHLVEKFQELTEITREWTKVAVETFNCYIQIFRLFPLDVAVERIRSKWNSIRRIQEELSKAFTPLNIVRYGSGFAIPVIVGGVTLGALGVSFASGLGLGIFCGAVVIGAIICGCIYAYDKKKMKRKLAEVRRLQRRLQNFETQWHALGAKMDQKSLLILIQVLKGIQENALEFHRELSRETEEEKKAPPECAICLDQLWQGSLVVVAPNTCITFHRFHKDCLDEHEKNKGQECPICRSPYESQAKGVS